MFKEELEGIVYCWGEDVKVKVEWMLNVVLVVSKDVMVKVMKDSVV